MTSEEVRMMTKKELVNNIQDLVEHYRQDLLLVHDGLASICKICWVKESDQIQNWVNVHLNECPSESK